MKILRFPFAAPLQSWGEDARWDTRLSSSIPTKSGIVGFLGCCLGYPRGDERLNCLNRNLLSAVRVDRPGRILADFQTVQGTGGVFLNAEGKLRGGGGTIITPKQYLQDAWFTVFLTGEETLLEKCFYALRHPRWTPYLGRKNCVPAVPVKPEWVEAASLEEAVRQFTQEDLKHCVRIVAVEMDAAAGTEDGGTVRTYRRNDYLIHAEKNEYMPRMVKGFTVVSGGEQS